MRTSPVVDRRDRETGLSLFELLVVLAILSLIASFSAALLVNTFPERRVESFASALEADLHVARRHVRRTGISVQLELSPVGYGLPELELTQDWPEDVRVSWRTPEAHWSTNPMIIRLSSSRLGWSGFQVRMEDNEYVHDIIQRPISGRIERSRDRIEDE